MKSIVERCAELRAALKRLRQLDDNDAKAEELEVRRNELENIRVELLQAAASAQVLLTHGHLPTNALPDCTKALESCDKVKLLADQDATSITTGRDYRNLLNRAGKVRDALSAKVKKSWEDVVAQHQGVDEAFLRRVEQFPGQAKTVARIRELKRAYDETTKDVPVDEDAYKRFEASYAALQPVLGELDPKAFPNDVLRFFRAAQQASGAPLSLFTENVRDWLEDKDFLDGVRVRFTGERQA